METQESETKQEGITTLPEYVDLWQTTLAWQPTPSQQSNFQQLYREIVQGNQQFNLTRITQPHEFWEKHLWDSLSGIAPWLTAGRDATPQRVVDIGTGAGFPGIPVAIAHPHWHLTLLDSTQKKVRFLQQLCQTLNLPHCEAITDRAENLGRQPHHRDQYDLALVRAVSSASTCAEYALPLLRLGGCAVLYRGQWSEQDSANLAPALDLLGGQIETIQAWTTPLSQGVRHCLIIRKTQPTDASFPRTVGTPAKEPL